MSLIENHAGERRPIKAVPLHPVRLAPETPQDKIERLEYELAEARRATRALQEKLRQQTAAARKHRNQANGAKAQATKLQRRIDEILGTLDARQEEGEAGLTLLLQVVARCGRISIADMRSRRRHREAAWIRQMFAFLARERTSAGLGTIGSMIDKDHTTVMHGIAQVEARLAAGHGGTRQLLADCQRELAPGKAKNA